MSLYRHNPEHDFQVLAELMAEMIQAQASLPIAPGESWMNDAQILAVKLFKQAQSVRGLLDQTNFEIRDGQAFSFVDHSSATILSRACLETYIVVHWIFQSEDPALRKFRHGLWRLGGLMDRLDLHPSTAEGRAKIESTRREVAELLPELEASPFIQSYTPKQVKKLLKGDWRVDWSWTEEAVRAGFHRKYFENVYGHFCGYAHSSYISSMQIGQARSIQDQRMLGQVSLQVCAHVISRLIYLYSALFPAGKEILDNAAIASRAIAQYWNFGAADMDRLYNQD